MARRTRYLGVSSSSGTAACAAWAAVSRTAAAGRAHDEHLMFISRTGSNAPDSGLEVAKYSFDDDSLHDKLSLFHTDESPQRFSVHPGGDILCCFSTSCRLMEVVNGDLNLSDKDPPALHSIGPQHKLVFSVDGSRVAFGNKDGHLRVYEWPSLSIIIDEPKAHKNIKDLDFSLDGALLASTSDDGLCRIWDLEKRLPLTTLHREKDERLGFCRFSRNGAHPFLFVTTNKDRRGYIAVWEIANWARLGAKKFLEEEISAFATSSDGKRLAIGSIHGDVAVVEVKRMEKRQHVKNAHLTNVTSVELSPNSRALLSVSTDGHVRVTATNIAAAWKDWQVYLLLIALITLSALVFYVFFEHSDSFWNFPLGRNQPARPPVRAIYGDAVSDDSTSGW